jgi:hypothetical protein
MIKFFRQIRQQLLSKNPPDPSIRAGKFSKYLLYAIGEIILVVIGILIALKINSWNQQRIEDKLETELLLGLMEEFQYNLVELDASLKVNQKVTQACLELTQIIRSDSITQASERVDNLLITIGSFNSFDARTGVSGEIVDSGKLNILKSDALRVQLVNWITLLEDCEEDILFRSDNYTMNLMPFLMKRFPLANGELTKKLAFDTNNYLETYTEKSPFEADLTKADLMEFENQIWHHKHNHDYVIINERNTRDFIQETLKMLEKELN